MNSFEAVVVSTVNKAQHVWRCVVVSGVQKSDVTTFPHAMAHRSGSRWPPPPPTTNGLSSEDSPCVMSFEDSHAVGPFGVPHRTIPPSRKAPNKQLQAVFLRLSPSCGLSQARNHSSHAQRAQPTPSSALPTPAPRARRMYSLCGSRAARTSRTQATPEHTHMRHKPTRTTRAATRPLSLQGMRFGAWHGRPRGGGSVP